MPLVRHARSHLRELAPAMWAMQDDDMIGIDDILEMLQPVAEHDLRAAAADAAVVAIDELARVEHFQAFVARQHGFLLRRVHVGEDQAVKFLHRIPRLAHAAAAPPTPRLARLLPSAASRAQPPAPLAAPHRALL